MTDFQILRLFLDTTPQPQVDEFIDRLKQMPYKRFLITRYWTAIKMHLVIERGYKCERCGKGSRLDLHHITYEHHGYEHNHLNDLRLLCRGCHGKAHQEWAAMDEAIGPELRKKLVVDKDLNVAAGSPE